MNYKLPLPCNKILFQLLKVNFETGKLYFKERESKWFKNNKGVNSWNAKFADKEAFYNINSNGYFRGTLFDKKYLAHRVIYKMYHGVDPLEVDHINGNRLDNQIKNLRSVTVQENNKNLGIRSTNTSGIQGVQWHKTAKKWQARIKFGIKHVHLGLFESLEDAAKARKEAEIKYGYHFNHGAR